jgi:hypothetical protein
MQRWSIIKNSVVEVSDERAIDAFTLGLRRGDLVEEMHRIKPKTVSDLMDIANRFADGEDACNKKRTLQQKVNTITRRRQGKQIQWPKEKIPQLQQLRFSQSSSRVIQRK